MKMVVVLFLSTELSEPQSTELSEPQSFSKILVEKI